MPPKKTAAPAAKPAPSAKAGKAVARAQAAEPAKTVRTAAPRKSATRPAAPAAETSAALKEAGTTPARRKAVPSKKKVASAPAAPSTDTIALVPEVGKSAQPRPATPGGRPRRIAHVQVVPAPATGDIPATARSVAPRASRVSGGATEVALPHGPDQAIAIYQIYFKPEQRGSLDPQFIPLDNAGHPDPLREFAVFERLSQEEGTRLAPLWGALSWRFGSKTSLDGRALRAAIAEHPGFDLYYCNPYPENEALYINSWQQGLTAHPAFMELCTAVFEAAGLPVSELQGIRPSTAFSACNYFVGSPAFWRSYLPWVRRVIDQTRKKAPPSVLRVLNSPLSDPLSLHANSSYWPFIIERLLPVFLATEGKALKTHKIALPGCEAKLNAHLQRLREMKDVAHRTHSRWLYACWLNYRNLYLLQTAGSDWCRQYLPQINVTDLEFL